MLLVWPLLVRLVSPVDPAWHGLTGIRPWLLLICRSAV